MVEADRKGVGGAASVSLSLVLLQVMKVMKVQPHEAFYFGLRRCERFLSCSSAVRSALKF